MTLQKIKNQKKAERQLATNQDIHKQKSELHKGRLKEALLKRDDD
jgi:hypothetical protein